jgi:pimeloyl-ACP methyl ester carboxylesterase
MMEMRDAAVPEHEVCIDLPGTDGLHIRGLLRGSLDQPVVVMMHGRPGYGNETQQYLGARYLYEQGLSSLRLWMYDWRPGTRDLVDCTLDTHAADFETVVNYLRQQGAKIVFATGHSYGGATILKSGARLDGAVLWDPTHGSYWTEHPAGDYASAMHVSGRVIDTNGAGCVLSEAAVTYDQSVGDTTNWAAGKGYPLLVLSAGKGAMTHLGKQYIDAADEPKKQVVIAQAHHQLDDSDEVMLELFGQTADWFKEIIRA